MSDIIAYCFLNENRNVLFTVGTIDDFIQNIGIGIEFQRIDQNQLQFGSSVITFCPLNEKLRGLKSKFDYVVIEEIANQIQVQELMQQILIPKTAPFYINS